MARTMADRKSKRSSCAAQGLGYSKRRTKNHPNGICRAKKNYYLGGCTETGPKEGKFKYKNGKKVYYKR
jgi:hypothetical protein